MKLKELNVGDKVGVYTISGKLGDVTSITDDISEVTILSKTERTVVIAWSKGSIIPASPEIRKDNGTYPQYVAWMNASPNRYCELITVAQTDGPCRQCSKPNSTSVSKCWWCQVSYPTDLKRVGP